MDGIPSVDELAKLMEAAAEEAVRALHHEEEEQEKKLARLMTKLDLCVFIPCTVLVIAVIVWLKLSIGPEVGTLTMPAGYAVVRACISRRI